MKKIDVSEIQGRGKFAVILKCLLMKKKITQCELASAVGISQATVTHYIKGKFTPSQKVLEKIADYLEVSPNVFYGDVEEYTPYLNLATNKFSIRLSELIKEKHLTCEQFAKEIGVSRQSISYYINERQMPTASIAKKIADYFDVTIDSLLNIDDIARNNRAMKLLVNRMPEQQKDCMFALEQDESDGSDKPCYCKIYGEDCQLKDGVCPYIEERR